MPERILISGKNRGWNKMKCFGCNHYDMNDSVHAFGTCEILNEDFHCTHECTCSKSEIQLVESLDEVGVEEYLVRITQTLEGFVKITAKSEDDAFQIAAERYVHKGKELPDMDDSGELSFSIESKNGKKPTITEEDGCVDSAFTEGERDR